MFSFGRVEASLFTTVSPPIPESNTPIGFCLSRVVQNNPYNNLSIAEVISFLTNS